MKRSKVDMIPGVPTTPRVVLEKMLERVKDGDVQDLVIIECNSEGDVEVYSTQMTRGHAVWLKHCFNKRFDP